MQRAPLDPWDTLSTFMASGDFRVESVIHRAVITAEDLIGLRISPAVIGHDDDGGGLIATRVPILGAAYCFDNAAMAEFRHRHDVLSSAIVDDDASQI